MYTEAIFNFQGDVETIAEEEDEIVRVPTNRKVKAVILSDSEDEGGSLNTLTCVSFNLIFLIFIVIDY